MSKPLVVFGAVNIKNGTVLPSACRYTAHAVREAMAADTEGGWVYWRTKGWRVRKVYIVEVGKGYVRLI